MVHGCVARGHGASVRGMTDLLVLQDRCRRDPDAYRDEFMLQHRRYLAAVDLIRMKPETVPPDFELLVHFVSHLATSCEAPPRCPRRLPRAAQPQTARDCARRAPATAIAVAAAAGGALSLPRPAAGSVSRCCTNPD